MMQSRKALMSGAVLFAAVIAGNVFAAAQAAPSIETQDVQVIKSNGDTQFVRYLDAVRTQNERDAREALIQKLRQTRDDLRNYAMIARGGKMVDEQKAAASALKAVQTNISALQAKAPGTNADPQDSTPLDSLLFELGSN